jgi:hypothetical protein
MLLMKEQREVRLKNIVGVSKVWFSRIVIKVAKLNFNQEERQYLSRQIVKSQIRASEQLILVKKFQIFKYTIFILQHPQTLFITKINA